MHHDDHESSEGEKLRQEFDRNMLELSREDDLKRRVARFECVVNGTLAGIFVMIARLFRRTRNGWVVQAASYIGVGGVVAAVFFFADLRADVRQNTKLSNKNESTCEKLTEAQTQQTIGIVQLSANVDKLMEARSIPRSGPRDWRRTARRLRVTLPDSIYGEDSVPGGNP